MLSFFISGRLLESENRTQTIRTDRSIPDTYRPDIDGLRAVAVLSVVFHHAGVALFSGGYVGVDVFFVISGFLITRLTVEEIEQSGRLDFGRFYLRRARRLLPAFFCTLVASSVAAVCLFSPQLLERYGASLIHAAFSVSNIYFYSESGYFDGSSSLKPLLHTWSLGVEEQFYLLWPMMLYLLRPRELLAPVCAAAVGLVSLLGAQMMMTDQATAVFFLTPFRVCEFSVGAVLVWLLRTRRRNTFTLDLLLLSGMVLIGCTVVGYSDKTPFPGVNALVPCMGAALCIYAGEAPIAGKLLRNHLLVAVGIISYSLYLTHWPMIVFYKYYIGSREFSGMESVLLVCASFVTAASMYICIERPFRQGKASNISFLLSCVLLSLSISYSAASMWGKEGWNWRSWAVSGAVSMEAFKSGKERRFYVREKICRQKGWAACDERIKGSVNALIVGDSHAPDALNAFEKLYPTHNFSLSALPACPPHHDIETITLPNHPERARCKALNMKRFDPEYLRGFDYIVINILFAWYTPDHLREYLNFMKANNIQKVVVLGDYLVLRRDMYELLNEYGYNTEAVKEWIDDDPSLESSLRNHVAGAGYFFLSKRDALCRDEHCELFDSSKIPFTYDQHHLAYEFAVRLTADKKDALDRFLGFGETSNN